MITMSGWHKNEKQGTGTAIRECCRRRISRTAEDLDDRCYL